jgi:hypothetical protein
MLAISMRKARVLESAAACRQVLAAATLIVYYFMTCVVEHMVRCIAAFCSLIFLLLSSIAILLYLQYFVKCPMFSPQTMQ